MLGNVAGRRQQKAALFTLPLASVSTYTGKFRDAEGGIPYKDEYLQCNKQSGTPNYFLLSVHYKLQTKGGAVCRR